MASQEKPMPFIKNLASSDRKTRTAALESLRTFLSAKHISSCLSTLDILKLWKGLFYALWMCDRPLPQQALCQDLADLVWVLPEPAVIPWLRGFWATMAREWTTGIDVLRMEKFLLLVRRTLASSLVWMQLREPARKTARPRKRAADGQIAHSSAWFDDKRVEQMLELLADWPFRPDEESRHEEEDDALMPKIVPVGMKLHVLDIWVDEAEKARMLEESHGPEARGGRSRKDKGEHEALSGGEVLHRLGDLVETLHSATLSPAVRKRSKESLLDERLPRNRQRGDHDESGGGNGGSDDGHGGDGDDDDEWGGLD
ncbi:ribosomal RNA-processing protein 1 [Diaporthe amygdali]|uniref:ribosomal RNA-processing protein 1 n=1 Tax=Phomopsis amygdali TaxID=1214568 RepID=UPI0022FF3450|nr:ribosomal RNA-processing protein 1 [Diaporthe amygdali]KAJ0104117.1 ribosomal RNA-processing protein 1 [Diaporthe amygdali]